MFSETDYVAYHGFAYLKNAISSHSMGLRIQIVLDHEEDYKAFKEFRKHRKGKAGTGLYACYTKTEEQDDWYGPVDLKFIRWAISSVNGAVVTFELDDIQQWKAMREAPALDAGYEQHQLKKTEFVLVELDQEGKPVNVAQKAKLEKMAAKRKWPKGGAQSKRAARLGTDKEFRKWLSATGKVPESAKAAEVADWLRKECDIDSRAQLDHDAAALQRFEDRVTGPFLRWCM